MRKEDRGLITLSLNKLRRFAFKIRKGFIYYFDDEGVVRRFQCRDLKFHPEIEGVSTRPNGSLYICPFDIFLRVTGDDERKKRMAIARVNVGDTYKDVEHYLNTLKPAEPGTRKVSGLDRFICRIYKPEFHRLPENMQKNTFDFIIMEVSILSEEAIPNRDEYLQQNIHKICQRVVEKLKTNRSFTKYGVPINFLKATSITLNKRIGILRIQFDLKDISGQTE